MLAHLIQAAPQPKQKREKMPSKNREAADPKLAEVAIWLYCRETQFAKHPAVLVGGRSRRGAVEEMPVNVQIRSVHRVK
jgi:hypothetical protein